MRKNKQLLRFSFAVAVLFTIVTAPAATLAATPEGGGGAAAQGPGERSWTLAELEKRALAHHPLLAAARDNVEAFEAKLFQARYSWVPQGKVESLLAVIPGQRGDAVKGDTYYDEWGPFTRTELSLAWPLYTFGKLSALKAAAGAGVDVARAQASIAEAEARRQVHEAYSILVFAREAGRVIKDGREHLDRAQKTLNESEEEDDDDYDPTDKLRLRLVEVDVEEKEIEARQGSRLAAEALRLLADLAPTDSVALADDKLAAPKDELPALEACLEAAKIRRPELVALKSGLLMSGAGAELAEARIYPDIVLIGKQIIARAPTADDQASPFANDPYNLIGGGVGIALKWNVDVVGSIARLREAEAVGRRVEQQLRAAEMAVELEVRKAHQTYADQLERARLAKRAYKAARGWLTAKADLFDAGFVQFDALSSAVKAFYERRLKELEARLRAVRARLDLSLAVGVPVESLSTLVPAGEATP